MGPDATPVPGRCPCRQSEPVLPRPGGAWLVENQQIRQILDIGAGLPTQGSVLETAHEINPRIRVACVDLDPVTIVYSRSLLTGNEFACVRRLDLRDPGSIVHDEQVAEFLDLSQPVAVVLGGVLGFIPDGDHPRSIIRTIGEALLPGSFLCSPTPARM